MLVALIRGEAQPQPLIDFGFEIVERDSTKKGSPNSIIESFFNINPFDL